MEVSTIEFPCNEWIQSSNFIEETEVVGFKPIHLAWSNFVGLKLVPLSIFNTVENGNNYHYGIGNLRAFNWGIFGPGNGYYNVLKVELYITKSKNKSIYSMGVVIPLVYFRHQVSRPKRSL